MSLIETLAASAEQKFNALKEQAESEKLALEEFSKSTISALMAEACQDQIPSELLNELGADLVFSNRRDPLKSINGSVGCYEFTLIDEIGQNLVGRVEFSFARTPTTENWSCEISRITVPNTDASGEWTLSTNRDPQQTQAVLFPIEETTWGETLAHIVHTWHQAISRNRKELEHKKLRDAEQQATAEKEREQARLEKSQALKRFSVFRDEALQIDQEIQDAIATEISKTCELKETFTLYKWTWNTASFLVDEDDEDVGDYDSGYSTFDALDKDGWIHLIDRGRAIKLDMSAHRPVVERILVANINDLREAWLTDNKSVKIKEIVEQYSGCYGQGFRALAWNFSDDSVGIRRGIPWPKDWLIPFLGVGQAPSVITIKSNAKQVEVQATFNEKWGDEFDEDDTPF